MTQVVLVKHKFPNSITLRIQLCNFQITPRIFLRTNYVDTTNHSNTVHSFSHVIYVPQTCMCEDIAKYLIRSINIVW